jgi:signal transduction histidine kinase
MLEFTAARLEALEAGEIVGLIELVGAQARQLEALKQGVTRLEHRIQARIQFDSILAQELRTPLAVVMTALDGLRDTSLTEAGRARLVERARTQACYVAELVDDMTAPPGREGPAVARANHRTAPLGELIKRMLDAIGARLPLERLVVDVPQGLQVTTSASRFVAMVVNLVENAMASGGDEPVELSVRLNDDGLLIVEVSDRGPSVSDQTRDFEPGIRPTEDQSRGLGLYIVRLLARSLGGTTYLDRRPGGGTVSRIELPQRRAGDVR